MARKSVRRRRLKHTPPPKQTREKNQTKLSKNDFIIYLASALVLKNVQWISQSNPRGFIESLKAVYDTVHYSALYERITFDIDADSLHGDSADINAMVNYLCETWACKDRDGRVYVDMMPVSIAEKYLGPPEGRKSSVWLQAAESFIIYATPKHLVGMQRNVSYI